MKIEEIYKAIVAPKNQIFFVEKDGLSMSHANHIANMIKNILMPIDTTFKNLRAFRETITINDDEHPLTSGEIFDIKSLTQAINEEANSYGYSAWLREAIKAKEFLLEFFKGCSETHFILETDDEIEEYDKQPKAAGTDVKKAINYLVEDVIGMMTIAEKAKYLALEAKGAHIGSKIHPGGSVYQCRADLLKGPTVKFKEISKGKDGTETCIIKQTPFYNSNDFNNFYVALHDEHRSVNEQLNYIKAELKNKTADLNNAELTRYRNEMAKANTEYQRELSVYLEKYNKITKQKEDFTLVLSQRRLALIRYISKLKIAIPNEFKTVHEEYAKLMKGTQD